MPNKMQLITELSNNVTKEITNTPENWLSFLDTASNNYKYSFNEQILIYAQRPDATVCTDIDTWNKRLHRWIKKGSKGDEVKKLQKNLNKLGFKDNANKPLVEDGNFGAKTEEALKKFQKAKSLEVDGVYGQNSYKAMSKVIK